MSTPPPGAISSSPTPRRAPFWQVVLGVLISGGLLYFSLRGTHFSEVLGYVRVVKPGPLALGVALATATFALRIFRWQVLLHGDDGARLPATPLWHAIAMGFMANNVLPLRAGEVVRTFAAAHLTGTRFTSVLASIAVERLLDGVTVVVLMLAGIAFASLPAGAVAGIGVGRIVMVAGLLALAALAAAGVVIAFPEAAERMVRWLVPAPRLADRLVGMIEGIRHGLSALRSLARIAQALLWSAAVWGTSALSFHVAFAAFGIPVGFSGALLMQGLIMFGIALPSTPGYAGVFELPIIAVLTLYSVDRSQAAAYALTYHVATFLPITLLGAWSVVRTNLSLAAFRQAPPRP